MKSSRTTNDATLEIPGLYKTLLYSNMRCFDVILFAVVLLVVQITESSSFVIQRRSLYSTNLVPHHKISSLGLSIDPNADIDKGLQRARALLEKTKEKLEAKANGKTTPSTSSSPEQPVPFFASQQSRKTTPSREGVVKTKDETTGLITTDGELLAQISESEEWTIRPLRELVDNDSDRQAAAFAAANEQLSSRDIAASIFNLRRELQKSDYEAIFDKRNYFIGEDT